MSCIGVLYRTKADNSPNSDTYVGVDLQANYWKLPRRYWEYWRFLDLGTLIYNAKDIESVLFYVPFKVVLDDLEDLGSVLVKDNLLSVLFNESYKIEDDPDIPGYHYASVVHDETKPEFWVYSLSNANFVIHDLAVGSLVEVAIKTKPKINIGIQNAESPKSNYNLYIRFRIKNVPENGLSYIESVSNDFFQSAFSRTEMLNLHINVISEIDEDDYKELASKYSFVNFCKVHFFFVASSEEETVYGATNYSDSRLLESSKWNLYIGDNNPQGKKCIAYHWKKEGPLSSCNIFLRTVYSSANIKKIIKYSVVVLILGILASLIASLLTPTCKCNVGSNPCDSTMVCITK